MNVVICAVLLLGSYACATASLFTSDAVSGWLFAAGWLLLMAFCKRVLFPRGARP